MPHDKKNLSGLPDDIIAKVVWHTLRMHATGACNFCAASRHLQRFVASIKQWVPEICVHWLHAHANGHLIFNRTLIGLQHHCPYNVFAAGNLLPKESVIAWDLGIEMSSYNYGFMDVGVCDDQCNVRSNVCIVSPFPNF